ncbi:MAG: manganese efflux pump [Desulfobacterales bacterium]|nr:manganese efflux pump [Desulfobacterales bacterium]MBF0397547.1 manganese efflux pump [Desulfobacterales bacterium]
MKLTSILAISVALAMDAFAVAFATGVGLKALNFRQIFRLSWHFGFFQAMMPVIGWQLGLKVRVYIEQYDHWVAFILLAFVGGKMIFESFSHKEEESIKKDPTKGMSLVVLSVATSIDALAVGLSIAMLRISILLPAIVIGITAFIFTVTGMILGRKTGSISYLSQYAELLGGIVLCGIGLNIIYEHGVLG